MVTTTQDHEVALRGAWSVGDHPGPALVECREADFLPALMAKLAAQDPASVVAAAKPTTRLYQPVHRVFNVVLVEAHCDTFGTPRLDPTKIDSAGMVVRRIDAQGHAEGWLSRDHQRAKWHRLTGDLTKWEPDPARRRPLRVTGDAVVDAELDRESNPLAESTVSLFQVTPALAQKVGRTLLYGVLPVTSSEKEDVTAALPAFDRGDWASHLCRFLRSTSRPLPIAFADGVINSHATELPVALPDNGDDAPPISPQEALGAARFVMLLRQLVQEFRLLNPPDVTAANRVIAHLNTLSLAGTNEPAGNYIRKAGAVAFQDPAGAKYFGNGQLPISINAPTEWPQITEPFANQLVELLIPLAESVRKALVAPSGSIGRFDPEGARYEVRAFVRVKCEHGCPPRIVWSPPSVQYEIAAWHVPSPQPPTVVSLPDPFDSAFLAAARPGVTFSVPTSLANFLNQDPAKILAGEASRGGGISLGFLCGFSIPIITICAFILLNVILTLLNFIFRWIPFVKVCIPIPKR